MLTSISREWFARLHLSHWLAQFHFWHLTCFFLMPDLLSVHDTRTSFVSFLTFVIQVVTFIAVVRLLLHPHPGKALIRGRRNGVSLMNKNYWKPKTFARFCSDCEDLPRICRTFGKQVCCSRVPRNVLRWKLKISHAFWPLLPNLLDFSFKKY